MKSRAKINKWYIEGSDVVSGTMFSICKCYLIDGDPNRYSEGLRYRIAVSWIGDDNAKVT